MELDVFTLRNRDLLADNPSPHAAGSIEAELLRDKWRQVLLSAEGFVVAFVCLS